MNELEINHRCWNSRIQPKSYRVKMLEKNHHCWNGKQCREIGIMWAS